MPERMQAVCTTGSDQSGVEAGVLQPLSLERPRSDNKGGTAYYACACARMHVSAQSSLNQHMQNSTDNTDWQVFASFQHSQLIPGYRNDGGVQVAMDKEDLQHSKSGRSDIPMIGDA